MRKTVDVLNLTLKLIDDKNKIIKFENNKKILHFWVFYLKFIWNDPNK